MEGNLRKIIAEEVSKALNEEGYDYAAEERSYWDNKYYQDDTQKEAIISSALSFMQDLQGSEKKLAGQKQLSGTSPEVDEHLSEAITHINQAIETYFKTLPQEIKNEVVGRLGEIKIKE